MVSRGTAAPTKLKNDAIVEAVFEVRFQQSALAEIFLGAIAGHSAWTGYETRRLPSAVALPLELSDAIPNLRYQPVLEAVSPSETTMLRIGPRAISFHAKKPYPGWQAFRPDLHKVVESLFERAKDLQIERLGLRYINALTEADHGITSITDFDIDVAVAGEALPPSINLNFIQSLDDSSTATVRIATQGFIAANQPSGTSVVVDIDIASGPGFQTKEGSAVLQWIDFAHTKEKDEFFHLFKAQTIRDWSDD